MYFLLVTQEMNFQAAALCFALFGMPNDQVYSQPEFLDLTTGAAA
jgi:hypothetical protein